MRQSLTLCLGVPYDIVQTNKKGEYNICVALEFVDVDGIVVIVDVATTVVAAAAITVVAAVDVAVDVAAAAATAVAAADAAATAVAAAAADAAATAVAAVIADAAAATAAADMISVRAPGARHIGKASAMAIGKASTTQPGAIQDAAAALPPVQPEDPDQLSPKAAAAATANIN